MSWLRGSKQRDGNPQAPDLGLREFFAKHPGLARAHEWRWEVHRRTEVRGRTAEVWRGLVDPAREAVYGAVVRQGRNVILMVVLEHPQGLGGHWYAALYTSDGYKTRQGPMDAITSDETWAAMALSGIEAALRAADGLGTQGRTRAASDRAFQDFARLGSFPHIASWRVSTQVDDRLVPCAGGRIEFWEAIVGDGTDPMFTYPAIAAAFSSSGALVALVAAETMPSFHNEVYLGLFHSGQHTNFGPLDGEAFRERATALLSGLLADQAVSDAGDGCVVCRGNPAETMQPCGTCGKWVHLRCTARHQHAAPRVH